MKKKLTTVFFTAYILLGVLGFLLVTYVGSHLLENRLEKSISADMYQTAHRIAENNLVSHNITSSNMEEIRNNLSLAANYPDTIIWIINSNGQIILSTRKDISPDNPINLEGFNQPPGTAIIIRLVISTDIFPRHISARLHQSPRI